MQRHAHFRSVLKSVEEKADLVVASQVLHLRKAIRLVMVLVVEEKKPLPRLWILVALPSQYRGITSKQIKDWMTIEMKMFGSSIFEI